MVRLIPCVMGNVCKVWVRALTFSWIVHILYFMDFLFRVSQCWRDTTWCAGVRRSLTLNTFYSQGSINISFFGSAERGFVWEYNIWMKKKENLLSNLDLLRNQYNNYNAIQINMDVCVHTCVCAFACVRWCVNRCFIALITWTQICLCCHGSWLCCTNRSGTRLPRSSWRVKSKSKEMHICNLD